MVTYWIIHFIVVFGMFFITVVWDICNDNFPPNDMYDRAYYNIHYKIKMYRSIVIFLIFSSFIVFVFTHLSIEATIQ